MSVCCYLAQISVQIMFLLYHFYQSLQTRNSVNFSAIFKNEMSKCTLMSHLFKINHIWKIEQKAIVWRFIKQDVFCWKRGLAGFMVECISIF